MARTIRKSSMKDVPLPEIDDLSRLEHDPRFLHRIEQARNSLRAGRGMKLEEIKTE